MFSLLVFVLAISILISPIRSTSLPDPAAATVVSHSSDAFKIVGYFPHWGIYTSDYSVRQIHTNGSAAILTHINYAFANISPELKCYMETRAGWGDAYMDYGHRFSAEKSIDGIADTQEQNLKGHFNQLRKLKAMYPHLKILISIGGWTWSARFSDAALPENREAFVQSCIELFIRGDLPCIEEFAAGGLGVAAGLFDGIDIDWEFPAAPAFEGDPEVDLPPHVYREEDTPNFTALLAEFRRQLDLVGAETGRDYLLTIAAPGLHDQYSKIELDLIHPHLDFINLMTYNMHGAWNTTGPTNFHAPLYSSPFDPSPLPERNWSVDNTVYAYLESGIPADKLVMGVPFYGRGWTGVPNRNNGLYQSATTMRPAPATFEPGLEIYKRLKQLNYPAFRDPYTESFWIFDGTTFWSYDDPEAIAVKMDYVRTRELGGTMFWSLEGDDGTLIAVIGDALN